MRRWSGGEGGGDDAGRAPRGRIGWEEKAAATSICDLSPALPQAQMIGSEVAAGDVRSNNSRLLLPNGLPDFVAEASDDADPYHHAPTAGLHGLFSLPYPRLCDRLLRATHGSTAWVYVAHTVGRACRLCTAGLDDGCECEQPSYQAL